MKYIFWLLVAATVTWVFLMVNIILILWHFNLKHVLSLDKFTDILTEFLFSGSPYSGIEPPGYNDREEEQKRVKTKVINEWAKKYNKSPFQT